jgi:hypothetical protein
VRATVRVAIRIPDDVYAELCRRACRLGSSVNNEAARVLSGVTKQRRDFDAFVEAMRKDLEKGQTRKTHHSE